jgi:hypothetical protein
MIQSILVDETEAAALDVAAEVGFGEIYDVELRRPIAASVQRELTDMQRRFIELTRNQALSHITKLTVHEGVITVVEVEGSVDGMRFRRKLKV